MRIFFIISMVAVSFLYGCSACQEQESTVVSSATLQLLLPPPVVDEPKVAKSSAAPRVYRIDLRGDRSAATDVPPQIGTEPAPVPSAAMPPGAFLDDGLTNRLQERIRESQGDAAGPIKAQIYTSNQTLDEFVSYYENRGYKVTRVSIPATQIISPALRGNPDLASRVRLEDFENVQINQVIVEGAGISAADKYVDPDSFRMIDRLFITSMGK